MTAQLTFARDRTGRFIFTEAALARLVAQLRAATGQSDALLPETLLTAINLELVSASYEVAAQRSIPFHQAAGHIVRTRPHLFYLSRAIAVHDGSSQADVHLEEDAA